MRVAFVTAVQLGLACIEEILAVGGSLSLVITLPDDRAVGKSGRVSLEPICAANGIPLLKVRNINDVDAIQALRAARIDWLFIVGWSQIAGMEVLSTVSCGALGIHPTLLPEGRGRASIPWAILKQLQRTGVTLFLLAAGVDNGPIAGQIAIPISQGETATSLYGKVEVAHRHLIRATWSDLQAGTIRFRPQVETDASYWPGRKPQDGAIDISGSVFDAERLVRAVTRPYPGAFVDCGDVRYMVWSARVEVNTHGSIGATESAGELRIKFRDGELVAIEWDRISATGESAT